MLLADIPQKYAADVQLLSAYGAHLDPFDGRAMSNFIPEALAGLPITLFSTASQTCHLCFAADNVDGIVTLMQSVDRGWV
jgi:UDP-glucuronate decarboxylase